MTHCCGWSGTQSNHPRPPRNTTPRSRANQRSVWERVAKKKCEIRVNTWRIPITDLPDS
jgi:hypothetical protein